MKTLEQLKKDYIETTTAIIDLGAVDTLKELQSQLKVKEQPDNIEDKIDKHLKHINNNMNSALDNMADDIGELQDTVATDSETLKKQVVRLNERINGTQNKLEQITENPPLKITYVDMNNKIKHIEQHLTRGENNTVKFTSYEGLQELKKIKAEFDNLNSKSTSKEI